MSCCMIVFASASDSFAMISGGVPAGLRRPEPLASMATPASSKVGTSGSEASRVLPVTAIAFSLPALI